MAERNLTDSMGKKNGDGSHRRGSLLRKVLLCCTLVAVSSLGGVCLTGCSIVERVKYEFSGSGVDTWENAAIEEGYLTSVEEYYYNHLPEQLQEPYREIYVRLMRGEDSGDMMSSIGVKDFWDTYYAVLADHPEIFWLGPSAQVEESGLTNTVVSYDFEVTVPQEARASMREQIEAAADECISQIPEGASDYEKIKFVYEYIIETTAYDSQMPDTQNIQSVFLYHTSVCAGYSKAFQYVLNRMGLFCTYITGTIKDGGEHGWNLVRIGDQYYYVDVTWGDPVFANGLKEGTGVTNYNYLCCKSQDLFQTHVPGDAIPLPECTSDDFNYYKMNNCYYEEFDYDTIYQALMDSVWSEQDSIVMKFGTESAYLEAQYELFEADLLRDPGSYLMDLYGVDSWNYRYHTADQFWMITIYWK